LDEEVGVTIPDTTSWAEPLRALYGDCNESKGGVLMHSDMG
jgi:hypothetical protein